VHLERVHGLTVLVPAEPDRAAVHQVIFDELVRGIIAGCTEIELLVGPGDISLPYFPTTRLHAMAAVDLALA
jgi:aspartate racemase